MTADRKGIKEENDSRLQHRGAVLVQVICSFSIQFKRR